MLQFMADEGIEVLLNTELTEVAGHSGQHVALQVRSAGGPAVIEASDILVAAGRTPNTDSLGASRAGMELVSRGYIGVNDRLETTAPGIWAMGNAPAVPISPMSALTTSASSATTWLGAPAPCAAASSPSASSPTRSWPGSA